MRIYLCMCCMLISAEIVCLRQMNELLFASMANMPIWQPCHIPCPCWYSQSIPISPEFESLTCAAHSVSVCVGMRLNTQYSESPRVCLREEKYIKHMGNCVLCIFTHRYFCCIYLLTHFWSFDPDGLIDQILRRLHLLS